MRLVLDIGNSRLKWLSEDVRAGAGSAQLHTPIIHNQDFLMAFKDIQNELQSAGRTRTVDVITIGSVTADKTDISKVCQELWCVEPTYVCSTSTACGVKNSYAEPSKLGVDRWAAMGEAFCQAQSAVCVFDLGSAFTIDAVNTNGHHLGGYILPGLSMSRDSVTGGTSQVMVDEEHFDKAQPVWGRSTNAAVNNGIIYTAVTLIQNAIKNLRLELKMPVEAFITGGDAAKILPFVNDLVRYDENLVLKGIKRLADSM